MLKRPPHQRPRLLRRLWVNEHAHAVGLLLFVALFVGGYFSLHVGLEDEYERDIRPEVGNAVKLYGLREDGRTGRLELTVDGRAYVVGSKDPGPLGVNQIASVRGLLADTSRAIVAYNDQRTEYIEQVMGSFTLSRRNPRYSWAPLSSVAPVGNRGPGPTDAAEPRDDESVDSGGTLRIEVSTVMLSTLRELPPSEGTAQRLIALLEGAIVHRTSDIYPLAAESVADGDGQMDDAQPVYNAVSAAAHVCQNFVGLGDRLRGIFGLSVDDDATNGTSGNRGDSCSFVPLIASAGNHYPALALDCEAARSCPSQCGIGCFHAELERLVLSNPGFFWTMGKFRWFDVLLLAALGVLVRRLLDLSLTYARLRRGRIWGSNDAPILWNPREAVMTVMYIVFTPLLALAVVWVLTATDLLGEDAISLGDTVPHVVIVVAFLLGLFPNVAYDVLSRVVEAVFGAAGHTGEDRPPEGLDVERPRQPSTADGPEAGRVPGPVEANTGEPPSFDSLRIRIRQLLTGPLR